MRNGPLVLAVAVLAGTPLVMAAEKHSSVPLRVRLYDASHLAAATDTDAFDTAAAILKRTGVTPEWVMCRVGGSVDEQDACSFAPSAHELVIRLVRRPLRQEQAGPLPLGDAHVDTGVRAGTLATIYVDAVESLAHATGCSTTTLLGRVVAHEIGHLLLGTNRHATAGLMRAIWTSDQLKQNRPMDWVFPSRDAWRIRLAIQRRHADVRLQ